MKDVLTRLSVYLLIILFFTSAFNGWYNCGGYAPADCAVQSLAYYGVGWTFWMLVFEGVFRLTRYIRRNPRAKRIFFAVVGSYMIVQAAVWLFISIRQPEKLGVFILLLSGSFVWGGYVLIKKAKNLQQSIPVPDTQPLLAIQHDWDGLKVKDHSHYLYDPECGYCVRKAAFPTRPIDRP